MEIETLRTVAVIATPVFLFFLGIGFGAIGYFLRSLHSDINRKFEEADRRIDRVDRDLMEVRTSMPTRYVLKDDYIRTISVFGQKLDEIFKRLEELVEKIHGAP